MAIDTALRSAAGASIGTGASTSARLVPARNLDAVDGSKDGGAAAADTASSSAAPLRTSSAGVSLGSALQDSVARAQQALDYLERVSSQLESLKSEISAKLASAASNQRSQHAPQRTQGTQGTQSIDSAARQLAATLAARKSSAGGGVDANLHFDGQPARQRFRIRNIDIDSLQQSAPSTVAFSIGGVGGPQLAAGITGDQSSEDLARAIDRAVAPLGVHAGLDNGSLVFSTSEANWPAVRDSIAVSGRGRVATEEVAPQLAPQQWPSIGVEGGTASNADALRSSLREVVQALERVRHSQNAASNALSNASVQVAAASTPPPDVEMATEDFAGAAASTNYDSLVALSSALVGVSRERVLALLGLR